MKDLMPKISLFLAALTLGFSMFALLTHVFIAAGTVPEEADMNALAQRYYLIWLPSALLSIFYFFVTSKARYAFLALPIIFAPLDFVISMIIG